MRVWLRTKARASRCAFCHDALGGVRLACASCGAIYHTECVTLCVTLGCKGPLQRAPVRAVGQPIEVEGVAGGEVDVGLGDVVELAVNEQHGRCFVDATIFIGIPAAFLLMWLTMSELALLLLLLPIGAGVYVLMRGPGRYDFEGEPPVVVRRRAAMPLPVVPPAAKPK
jgi:hypothetical protein